MSNRRNNGYCFEERQRKCMIRLVRDILSDKSVEQITFENAHGAISVTRTVPERRSVTAIGFTADIENYDEGDDE